MNKTSTKEYIIASIFVILYCIVLVMPTKTNISLLIVQTIICTIINLIINRKINKANFFTVIKFEVVLYIIFIVIIYILYVAFANNNMSPLSFVCAFNICNKLISALPLGMFYLNYQDNQREEKN